MAPSVVHLRRVRQSNSHGVRSLRQRWADPRAAELACCCAKTRTGLSPTWRVDRKQRASCHTISIFQGGCRSPNSRFSRGWRARSLLAGPWSRSDLFAADRHGAGPSRYRRTLLSPASTSGIRWNIPIHRRPRATQAPPLVKTSASRPRITGLGNTGEFRLLHKRL